MNHPGHRADQHPMPGRAPDVVLERPRLDAGDRPDHDHDPDQQLTAAEATWPELRPVMADLAHVVHNASTLVLGHVAAVERTSGVDDKLHDRVHVIEAALGRINGVVDGLRAAVDPSFWGRPRAGLVVDVVHDAFATCATEADRRRIRVVYASDDPDGDRLVVDGARSTAAISALVASALERLGSDGSIRVEATAAPGGTGQIRVVASRDDGLALHGDARSVWEWIAAQLACQFGATVHRVDTSTTTILLELIGPR